MKEKINNIGIQSFAVIFAAAVLTGTAGALLANQAFATDHNVSVQVSISPTDYSPGTITSNPGNINCPDICNDDLAENTDVTFTQTTKSTTKFKEWFPNKSGTTCAEGTDTGKECTINTGTASSYEVNAKWADKVVVEPRALTPLTSGSSITLTPDGRTCGDECYYGDYGQGVEVTATANTSSSEIKFVGWISDIAEGCGSSTSCTVTIQPNEYGDAIISGDWEWKTIAVDLDLRGSGNGKVTSSPGKMNCSSDCSVAFPGDAEVTFTASAASGSKFAGWGSYDEGNELCVPTARKGGSTNDKRITENTCQEKITGNAKNIPLVAYFEKADTQTNTSNTSSDPNDTTQTTQEQEEDANNNSENTNDKTVAEKIGIKNLTINGEDIFASEQLPVYDSGQALTFSGKTKPNATLNLYIFSEPREATVKADDKGNWTYTVEGLEPGEHHVEAEVVDPKTNKPSKRVTVAAFSIAQPTSSSGSTQQPTAEGSASLLVIGGLLAAMAAAGLGGAFFYLKKTNRLHPLLRKLKVKMDNLSSRFSR